MDWNQLLGLDEIMAIGAEGERQAFLDTLSPNEAVAFEAVQAYRRRVCSESALLLEELAGRLQQDRLTNLEALTAVLCAQAGLDHVSLALGSAVRLLERRAALEARQSRPPKGD